MRKILTLLSLAALSACGGGSVGPAQPQIVKLSAQTIAEMPSPFVVGPSGTTPVPTTTVQLPFVVGPVIGPTVIVTPPVVIGPSRTTQPTINYCTDGFVVGPCTPLPSTCRPDTSGFVAGPCGG